MARFCHAPWVAINVHADGSYAPCCVLGMGDDKQYTYEDYNNSSSLKQLKADFRNGIEPESCKTCWYAESTGSFSSRMAVENEIEVTGIEIDIHKDEIIPPYSIQISATQICNLKCRICRPASSSKLVKEHNLLVSMGEREEKWTTPIRRFLADPHAVDWIKDNNENVMTFQVLGGEPFADLVDEQIELLESFKHPEEIALTYITNGTLWPPEKLINLWKKFRQALIIISVDGIEDTFEYGRFPAKWSLVENHVLQYKALSEEYPNIIYKLNNTVSILNILNLPDYLQWAKDKDIIAPTDLLYQPFHYNVHYMSREVKDYIINILQPHSEYADLIDTLTNADNPDLTAEFVKELKLLDSIREQSYTSIFPSDFVELLLKKV